MIFRETQPDDSERISDWIQRDLNHAGKMSSDWWLEGSVLSCCVEDNDGPVLYLRLDSEGSAVRLHIQFAPTEVVPKMRTAKAIMRGFPKLAEVMKEQGAKAILFESESNPLIKFMNKMGFDYWKDNDYVLLLSEEN